MREIKFRWWDTEEEKMSDPFEIGSELSMQTIFKIPLQYTGLQDREGKDIYEGDIVKNEQWIPENYEVVFDRGGFCLKPNDEAHYYPDIKYGKDFEIIGNKFESSEI